MDDNAETLLLNLMRGSGANGLKGMIEDNGEVFRPLLSISRTEILEYLKEKSQDYIVDSSNLESDYRRNFLRLEVIPLLESRWPAAKRMIAHSAEILARESRWLDSAMRRGKEGDQLYFHEVMDSPDPVTSIFYFIKGVGGSSSIAEEIWNSINSKDRSSGISGKWWRLDSGLRISLERDHIDILPSGRVPLLQLSEQSYEITPDLLVRIRNERNPEIAWLPYGLGNLEIRPVSEGDRIKLQNGSSALVSKLMKDQHYTRRMKESAPVVVMPDGAIVWVAGLRRSGIAYISDKDKTAHKLYISRNK